MITVDVRRAVDVLLGEVSKVRHTVSPDFLCTAYMSVVIDDHEICVEATRVEYIVRVTPLPKKS